MYHLRLLILGIYSLLLYIPIQSQNENIGTVYQFQHLSENDGLANDLVHSGLLDSKGFMWFGTHTGLSRWDGITFKNYLPNTQDATSIKGSLITSLLEDSEGYIWIGAHHYPLSRFDPLTETFTAFPYVQEGNNGALGGVVKMIQDSEGLIWIGVFDNGFYSFDPVKNTFKQFHLKENLTDSDARFRQNSVLDIVEDRLNPSILWIAGNDGLYQFNKNSEQLTYFESTAPFTNGSSIQQILMLDSTHLWLGTYGTGLVRFEIATEAWEYFMPDSAAFKKLNFNYNIITGIAAKSADEIWVASKDQGVGIFNIPTQTFSFFTSRLDDPNTIGGKIGYKIYKDYEDRPWFFLMENGLSYIDPTFHNFKFNPLPNDMFTAFQVKDFLFDRKKDGLFLLGWGVDGLYECALDGTVCRVIPAKGHAGQTQVFNDILRATNGETVIVGRHAQVGLQDNFIVRPSILKYDKEQEQLVPIQSTSITQLGLQQKNIVAIVEAQPNEIWGITSGREIFSLELTTGKAEVFILEDSLVTDRGFNDLLHLEGSSDLYIGANKGLLTFNMEEKKFESFSSTNNYTIRSLTIRKDKIWLGGSTLGLFDPAVREIESINHLDNIPTVDIDRLFVDTENRLWCTTQDGLYYLNDAEKRFNHFGATNGLDKELFYNNGISQHPNGQIYLGKENGFYSFEPDQLLRTLQPKQVMITEVEVNDSSYMIHGTGNSLEALELAPEENSIRIHYSSLAFSNQEKIQFAYQLEEVDNNWVVTSGKENLASYNKLTPGKYTFRVKANHQESQVITLPIHIAPPWYRSPVAYAGYGMITFGLFFWFTQFLLRKQEVENEAQRLKELNQFKTKLYTNITHEFRTPLTVIAGMANQIDQEVPRQLIQKNSDNLLNLVNQMLDLSKLEAGQLQPNYIQADLITYVKYLVASFHSFAQSKDREITFKSDFEELVMDYEPEFLKRILSNLITNALKFTNEHGKIEISIARDTTDTENVCLTVKDNGIGIEADQLPKIFDRFYQVVDGPTRQHEGTGIGLTLVKELVESMKGEIKVQSTSNEWTIFSIFLPIINEAELKKSPFQNKETIPLKNGLGKITLPTLPNTQAQQEVGPVILLLEDNEDVLFYLQSLLRKDYHLLLATNGKEGIEKAEKHIPDVIISDVMMPEKNGYEVCEQVKQSEKTSHIPIILLTARADQQDKIQGFTYGADAYLTKPFDEQELLIRLHQFIENKKRIQSFYQQHQNLPTELPVENKFLQKVQQTIEENYQKDSFALPQLCEALHLSRTQVFRKVKALTNQSPSEMIAQYRLQQGKQLLRTTNLTITEIAFQVGFKTQAHFSTAYKKHFGNVPSQER